MHICMYVCIYLCMYVRTYICMYVCMHVIPMYVYMYVCVCMYVFIYVCTYVPIYVCVCVCMHVIPMYVCVYVRKLVAPQSLSGRVRSRETLLRPPLVGFEPSTLFVTFTQVTTLCPKVCRLEFQRCDQIDWFTDKG